jgi:predicted nucleic acid-binding protein
MTLTFVDTGVLIAATRSRPEESHRAIAVLFDPSRTFASSVLVRLEVLPKPLYFRRRAEVAFYRAFFHRVAVWAPIDMALIVAAYREAIVTGMAAVDALHVAAARRVGAAEFITTEGTTKPMHRARGVTVITIRP